MSLTSNSNIRYRLKTPYRDAITHVIFEPQDFITRPAALVPKPRVNLTRFHGVFVPNRKYQALVTPENGVRVTNTTSLTRSKKGSLLNIERR